MIDWPLVLIVLAAVVVLGGLLWVAAWWYLPPVDLPGSSAPRLPRGSGSDEASGDGGAGEFHTDTTELCQECLGPDGIHCDGGDRYCDCPCGWEPDWAEQDDDWADQLHAINQLGKFGDLTRPVAHMTHYEVEALIRILAVPEWVPDRYRVAA